jgi:hypothetical protein
VPKESIALSSEWNFDEINTNQVRGTEATSSGDARSGTPSIVLITPDQFHSVVSVHSVSGEDPKTTLRSDATHPVFVAFSTVLEGKEIPVEHRIKLWFRTVGSYILGNTSPLVLVHLRSGPSGIQVEKA